MNTTTASSPGFLRRCWARAQHGVSFIEVLISLVVLTVGLLGTARLQAVSLRATTDSSNQGLAVRMGYDLADRIRLEPTQIDAYIAAAQLDLTTSSSSACYTGTGCGGADRVNAAVAEWQRLMALQLPGGVGTVCRDASPFDGTSPADAQCTGGATDPLVIKLWWRARVLQEQTSGGGVVVNSTGIETQRFVSVVGL